MTPRTYHFLHTAALEAYIERMAERRRALQLFGVEAPQTRAAAIAVDSAQSALIELEADHAPASVAA